MSSRKEGERKIAEWVSQDYCTELGNKKFKATVYLCDIHRTNEDGLVIVRIEGGPTRSGDDIKALADWFSEWCYTQVNLKWEDHILLSVGKDEGSVSETSVRVTDEVGVTVCIERIQVARRGKETWHRPSADAKYVNYGSPTKTSWKKDHVVLLPWSEDTWRQLTDIIERMRLLYDRIKEFMHPDKVLQNLQTLEANNLLPAPKSMKKDGETK